MEDKCILRKATLKDSAEIWEILQNAIERRKNDGSNQWQNGYPNKETAGIDIANEVGFVLEFDKKIAGYAAIIFDLEPAYEIIEGNWLREGKYSVIHRVAISDEFVGQGLATKLFIKIEDYVKSQEIFNIKVDTNFDNVQMLKILKKLNYTYCGEVYFRGSPRKAFQKILEEIE